MRFPAYTIARKEIAGYINSPVSYVFVIIFLLLSGFFTFMVSNFFEAGTASLEAFFQWMPWLFLVLVPALGMHIWADEKRLGTLEILFTLPVSPIQCIVGKFMAAWLFLVFALALTFPLIITVVWLGEPDPGAMACGYSGCILMGGAYLAISCMTSAMTGSQVVSFIVSELICVFLIFAGWTPIRGMLVKWAPLWLIDSVESMSVMPHFASMRRGVVDTRDIVYFLSVIVFSMFVTVVLLKNHRS